MVSLPLFERLKINGYGMYPGEGAGLSVEFRRGLTLVIGANGLGKTTLITILYRLLTGPFDIAAFSQRELGTAELKPTPLRERRLLLGQRVADGARQATGHLEMRIGKKRVKIVRSLHDLSLRSATIGINALPTNEEDVQNALTQLVGVSSFGDFMLILQHLLFYFETRRELVWDSSAQRELLRALFLSTEDANRWTNESREILKLDTLVRNSSFVRKRFEGELVKSAEQVATLPEVRTKLETLSRLQDVDVATRAELNSSIDSADAERQSCRLRQLTLSQAREARYRALERARLITITAAFPSQSESNRYILGQLMTDDYCLVCGSEAPVAAAILAGRLSRRKCVVCDSSIRSPKLKAVPGKELARLHQALSRVETELSTAASDSEAANKRYNLCQSEITRLNATISARTAMIEALVAQLPPEEAELHGKRSELAGLKAREDEYRRNLSEKRAGLKIFVDKMNLQIVAYADRITQSFQRFAEGFLVDDCALIWQTKKERLGQTGELFDFPAFQLNMSGAGFIEPTRRSGPDQVSESQREFIDLAFRMALIEVATVGHSGTLVIDAPESSLDLVFQGRAAAVLSRFAILHNNRLIVTSNLVAGAMLKALVNSIPVGERSARIVNLFYVAERTAAVRECWPDYKKELGKILA